MIDVRDLSFFLHRLRPGLPDPRYVRLATRILAVTRVDRPDIETELAIQEVLLGFGWNNPLRDAALLVDGPLRQESS